MQGHLIRGSKRGFWHRWISFDWLKQWADQGATQPVKNDPLLCSHGKLDPAKKTGLFLASLVSCWTHADMLSDVILSAQIEAVNSLRQV